MSASSTNDVPVSTRLMKVEHSLIARADGSARVFQGKTEVIAAVYGPAPVLASKELIDRATLEVTWKPKVGIPGVLHRMREHSIIGTLDPFIISTMNPRSLISVVIQEVSDDGSLMSAAINAAAFALIDAGIIMNGLPISITCAVMPTQSPNEVLNLTMDPTLEEEKAASAVCTFGFCMPKDKKLKDAEVEKEQPVRPGLVMSTFSKGALDDASALMSVVEACEKECPSILHQLRNTVEELHKKGNS